MSNNNAKTVLEQEFKDKAIMGVDVNISVVLGRSMLRVNQMLKLGRGAVLELNQKMDQPVEVYANDILIAHGEVIVTDDDHIGITIRDMIKVK